MPNRSWEAGLVKSRTKMLPQSHFIEFSDIKSKHFSNVLWDPSVYIIDCIHQPVAQEPDKILVLVCCTCAQVL